MEQLLCHLVADYWLQNDWMATNKKKKWFPAIVHGFIYTLPFLLLTHSFMALLVIGITHIIIDHTDIVCRLNQIKNWDFRQDNYSFFYFCSSIILYKNLFVLRSYHFLAILTKYLRIKLHHLNLDNDK